MLVTRRNLEKYEVIHFARINMLNTVVMILGTIIGLPVAMWLAQVSYCVNLYQISTNNTVNSVKLRQLSPRLVLMIENTSAR